MGMTTQYFHTIPTSCAILLPLSYTNNVQWRVVEGSVVHVDVHAWAVIELYCG